LIIGEHAVVHADVRAGEVEVHGQVFGTIEAKRRIEISPSGRVRGDIQATVLSVNPGGVLDGRIRMADERPDEMTIATQSGERSAAQHESRG
jgi:cytoskeletal protein CcmA (bactofilin family)